MIMKTSLVLTLALSLTAFVAVAADGEKKPAPTTPPAAGGAKLPDALKKYDKNGDGKLDEEERKTFQKERQAEIMKKYDTNSDGKLDEKERQVMMEDRKKERDEMMKKRQADIGKPRPPVAPAPAPKPEEKK
jgi:EF hand